MLSVFGLSTTERAKSVSIAVLSILLAVSLLQVSAGRAQMEQEKRDKDAAVDIARRFAIALTTYDYAHQRAQAELVAGVSSQVVMDRVRAAWLDVESAKAASLGDVTADTVVVATQSDAEVLVWTSQVVSNRFVVAGSTLVGLLDVWARLTDGRWIVTDYRWLLFPGPGP